MKRRDDRARLRHMPDHARDDAAKLEALREAARAGIAAIEHGEARIFADADELALHLDSLVDAAIGEASSS